jgi:hypothetical protein
VGIGIEDYHMYFDELRPRRNRNGIAQEYWNGAAASDPSLSADIFDAAISMLPERSSSQPALRIKLQDIGRQLRRNLRQDDWGPTRGDQTEALRQIAGKIDLLRSALNELSLKEADRFYVNFEDAFLEQPPRSWADLMSLLEEVATFCGHPSTPNDHFSNIAAHAEYFIDYPARVDDNTHSALFDANAGSNIEGPDFKREHCMMGSILCWLTQFRTLHEKALSFLEVRRGPERFLSLRLAVSKLAELYTFETGSDVTHYLDAAGAPASEGGKFILVAILAMRPRHSELDLEFIRSLGKQASGWLSEAALTKRVSQALKIYVRDVVQPDRRGRKS